MFDGQLNRDSFFYFFYFVIPAACKPFGEWPEDKTEKQHKRKYS